MLGNRLYGGRGRRGVRRLLLRNLYKKLTMSFLKIETEGLLFLNLQKCINHFGVFERVFGPVDAVGG